MAIARIATADWGQANDPDAARGAQGEKRAQLAKTNIFLESSNFKRELRS